MTPLKFRTYLIFFLAAILSYVILLFLQAAGYIAVPANVITLDYRVVELLLSWRLPALTDALLAITFFGEIKLVLCAAVLLTFCLRLWKKTSSALSLWMIVIGTEITVWLGKFSMLRPRPDGAAYLETSASFPSGHAAISVAFFGYIIYLLWRRRANFIYRLIVLCLGAIFILAVGFSRLYLGVHYISDVAAGYLLGLLWLAFGIILNERLNPPKAEV